jgi:hypothetical protein
MVKNIVTEESVSIPAGGTTILALKTFTEFPV